MIAKLLKCVKVLIQKITKDTNSDMPTKRKKNLSKILKILVGYKKLVGN